MPGLHSKYSLYHDCSHLSPNHALHVLISVAVKIVIHPKIVGLAFIYIEVKSLHLQWCHS